MRVLHTGRQCSHMTVKVDTSKGARACYIYGALAVCLYRRYPGVALLLDQFGACTRSKIHPVYTAAICSIYIIINEVVFKRNARGSTEEVAAQKLQPYMRQACAVQLGNEIFGHDRLPHISNCR